MKYIDADKLIAEIEKRIEICEDCEREGYPDTTSSEATLKSIRSFIASLQQEQTNAYDVAMLEVKEYVDKLYDEAGIGTCEYDSGFYNGIIETCMKLRGFIKARTSKEQQEVDLENYISGKLRELGADLINHKPYSFNRGLNVGKANAYNDILGRLKARKGDTK